MKLKDRYLRMSDLANQPERPHKPASHGITGFSAKHLYHLIKLGKFPTPIKLGRASLWRVSDINRWLDSHDNSSNDEEHSHE